MTDDLGDLLVPTDAPEVQRLTTIVNRLPESRRVELMSRLLRAVVTYEGTTDPHREVPDPGLAGGDPA